jgi:hypothetical protein
VLISLEGCGASTSKEQIRIRIRNPEQTGKTVMKKSQNSLEKPFLVFELIFGLNVFGISAFEIRIR